MPNITPQAKAVNDLLRRARVLRRHYDMACAYVAQDPNIMHRMFDELLEMRAEFPENSSKHDRLTAELEQYVNRHAGQLWPSSRVSAAAMAR